MKKRKQNEPQTQITNEAKKANLASDSGCEDKVTTLVEAVTNNEPHDKLVSLCSTFGRNVVASALIKLAKGEGSEEDILNLAEATPDPLSTLDNSWTKARNIRNKNITSTFV